MQKFSLYVRVEKKIYIEFWLDNYCYFGANFQCLENKPAVRITRILTTGIFIGNCVSNSAMCGGLDDFAEGWVRVDDVLQIVERCAYADKRTHFLHEVGRMRTEQMAAQQFAVVTYNELAEAVGFVEAYCLSVGTEERFLAGAGYAFFLAFVFGQPHGSRFRHGEYSRRHHVEI